MSAAFQKVAAIVGQPDAAFLEHQGYNLVYVLQTFNQQSATVMFVDSSDGQKSEDAVKRARGILCKLLENINPNMGVDIMTRDNVLYTLAPSRFHILIHSPTNGVFEIPNCPRNMSVFGLLKTCYQQMPDDEREIPLSDYRFTFDNGVLLNVAKTLGEHKINELSFHLHIVSKTQLQKRITQKLDKDSK